MTTSVDRWANGLKKLSVRCGEVSVGGYDAAESTNRRRHPLTVTMAEDEHAKDRHRIILSATARDLHRNWAVAQMAIRKHVDFIADFTFQGKTPDDGYNKYLEAWWKEKTRKHNFDVAARHNHRNATRIAEACRTLDGDVGWLKLAPPKGDPNRGCIQAIESDRIAMPRWSIPRNAKPEDWVNGVRIDTSTGRALAYGICRRAGRTRKELERIVSAKNMMLYAWHQFRYDQIRGLSPIAAAINDFRDTQEGFQYAYAKMKVGQMFGLQILHDAEAGAGPLPSEDTEDENGDDVSDSAPKVNLHRAPYVVEMEPGERAEVLESKTPSTETVAFLKLAIHVALRSLDIPYSFFDESFTNFYGSRGGLMQYLHACHSKVLDLQEHLDDHTKWRAGIDVEDGELELPSGKDFSYLAWEHVPGGVPWWDTTKEVRGAAMSIGAGFSSPSRVCREIGTNFRQNIDETADDLAYAKAKGVPLYYGDNTAFAPEIIQGGASNGE